MICGLTPEFGMNHGAGQYSRSRLMVLPSTLKLFAMQTLSLEQNTSVWQWRQPNITLCLDPYAKLNK